MATVSVCIPTYNRKEYLKKALESVFTQTFKDYEVIVVDDGSTDGTGEMIKNNNYDVRYYRFDSMGQYAARNKLIELAHGQYLTFLDSDDVLMPRALEKLIKPFEQYGTDVMVYGRCEGMDEHGNIAKKKNHSLPSGMITKELFGFIYVHSGGTLCTKRIYEDAGGFDTSLRRCAFYKLLLELSLEYPFIPVDYVVYLKRRHNGNQEDRRFEGCKTELEMLENFYRVQPKEIIPEELATRRLASEAYRAGKCAMKEDNNSQARRYLKKSAQLRPRPKTLFYLARARIKNGTSRCWKK